MLECESAAAAFASLEAAEGGGIVQESRREGLNRDVALEVGVARAVYLAHAPGPDRLDDLVGSESCPRSERHDRQWYAPFVPPCLWLPFPLKLC